MIDNYRIATSLSDAGNTINEALTFLDDRVSSFESHVQFQFDANETIISWNDHNTGLERRLSLNRIYDAVDFIDNLDNKLSNIEERMDSIEYYADTQEDAVG